MAAPAARNNGPRGRARGLNITFLGHPDGRSSPPSSCAATSAGSCASSPDRHGCCPVARAQLGPDLGQPPRPPGRRGGRPVRRLYPDARNPFAHPELLEEGFEPHAVAEVWLMASPRANRAVDITDVFERKVTALRRHESQVATRPTWAPGCGRGPLTAPGPPACPRAAWPNCSSLCPCRLRARREDWPVRGPAGPGPAAGGPGGASGAPRHLERELAQGPYGQGPGVARLRPAGRRVPARDQAERRRLPPHGFCRPRLRIGAPWLGAMERCGAALPFPGWAWRTR